jgi:hydrogenase/urease accessory protein HupE
VGIAHVRALTIALLCSVAAGLHAHEIGTTQVTVRFARTATYTVDVVTGPNALLSKIERHRSNLSPELARQRLRTHARELLGAADIAFGGVRVAPHVVVLDDDTVRFSGDVPRNAGPFTWRWRLTYSSYALRLPSRTVWLDADAMSPPELLSAEVLPPRRIDVARQYLRLGFTHIVPYGLDHILFVLGIFLLAPKLRAVLTQVTAFTIAHSITLALSIYGIVSVSPRIVEPMIAVSIAYVAIENLTTTRVRASRIALVFAFGLLHGLGFAGALRELQLPRSEFVTALITFNIGVELGQLSIVATAFCLIAYWHRAKPWYRYRFVMPASAAIAAAGIFWTIQRVVM